jgi:hypothetical protein
MKLAKHLTLVPADYRALLKATDVQRATWKRAGEDPTATGVVAAAKKS